MTTPVIITVTVDVLKLREQYSSGGSIEKDGIILMTDNQTESYYKNGRKDKLVTVVDPEDTIEWTINANDNSTQLEFINCEPSTKLKSMLAEQPGPDPISLGKWKAKLSKTVSKSEIGFYTFQFAVKNDKSKIWRWDPDIQIKPPKP